MTNIFTNKYFVIILLIAIIVILFMYAKKKTCDVKKIDIIQDKDIENNKIEDINSTDTPKKSSKSGRSGRSSRSSKSSKSSKSVIPKMTRDDFFKRMNSLFDEYTDSNSNNSNRRRHKKSKY